MDMSYTVPLLYSRKGTNRPEMLGGENGLPNAGNTFNAHVFVVLTAGALVVVASAATLTCGLSLDASKSESGVNPPYAMFGDRHFPVALEGQRFAISVTDASGNYGEANGAPQMSELTIGQTYGIIKLANGNHALNVDNTSNAFFKVVEKPSIWTGQAQDANTYNPVVIVEVVSAAIQSV